jgi:hypothetical protein
MPRARRVTTVPKLVGMEAEAACLTVLAADLTPYGSREYAPAPETGTVVRQDPPAGAQAAPGAPVILATDGGGRGAEPSTPKPTTSGAPEPEDWDALTPARPPPPSRLLVLVGASAETSNRGRRHGPLPPTCISSW